MCEAMAMTMAVAVSLPVVLNLVPVDPLAADWIAILRAPTMCQDPPLDPGELSRS